MPARRPLAAVRAGSEVLETYADGEPGVFAHCTLTRPAGLGRLPHTLT